MADMETPVSVFAKIRTGETSFLLESVEGGERVARYSLIGSAPERVLRVGPGCEFEGDPLAVLERELAGFRLLSVPGQSLPAFTGGAVGYVSYDCVRHFEPRTERAIGAQVDDVGIPESTFLLCLSAVVFDHVRHTLKVVSHCRLDTEDLDAEYAATAQRVQDLVRRVARGRAADSSSTSSSTSSASATATDEVVDEVDEGRTAEERREAWARTSNVGREGYEGFVDSLKRHIVAGDIIQAVPSQRLRRRLPGGVTPFDLYRQLRVVNPSPYMFYVEAGSGLQIIGASPEMLCKVEVGGKVITHPIAGTRKRGKSPEEDEALARELLANEKERAEHIMLVDLGRNDVGRVAAPGSVRVDSLMHIERYSHVMHIVSQVSGQLGEGRTAYDAFRAIFPAGTVSGAPKIRAIELVAELEPQRRHVYAGAVGYVAFGGELNTAIAIRTMFVKDGVLHLQAGAGIVYDSVPSDEYEETVSKLGATVRAVELALESTRARRAFAAAEKETSGGGSGGAGGGGSGGR